MSWRHTLGYAYIYIYVHIIYTYIFTSRLLRLLLFSQRKIDRHRLCPCTWEAKPRTSRAQGTMYSGCCTFYGQWLLHESVSHNTDSWGRSVCVSLPVFATLIVVDVQCYCMTVCCSQLGMCQCSRASCCLRISGTQKTSQSTVFRQMATQCGKRRRLRLTHGARKRRVRRDQQWSNCSAQHRRADDATPKETFEGQCQLSSHKQQCEPLRFHRFLFYASWSDVWAIENGVPQ